MSKSKAKLTARGKIATLLDTLDNLRKVDIHAETVAHVEVTGWRSREL